MPPVMTETRYDASAELARPRLFLRRALTDLAASPRIGRRLFAARQRGKARRSLLGYARLVLPAAAITFLCLYLQAAGILAVGPTAMPYPLYVISGVLLWQIFVEALNQPSWQLLAARQLLSRSAIPHEAILFGALCDVLMAAAVRLALIVALSWAFGFPFLPGSGLLVGTAGLILLGFTLGLCVSPLALLYDDVRDGLTMLTTLWFVLTPVAYAPVDDGWTRFNPVTPLLDAARSSLAGGEIGARLWLVCAIAVVLLVIGWLFYRLAKPHVVERIG